MTETIRVLIVDDHEIVRDGLRLVLETENDFVVVGTASDGAEAVVSTRDLQPHVVLMDIRMKGVNGLEALRRIRRELPEVSVVMLTTYDEDQLVRDALRAGAQGYLLKEADRATLFRTIRAAVRGETLLSPEMVSRMMAKSGTGQSRTREPLPSTRLTHREREILEAITRGDRSREIAIRFGITERTVKAHLASVYAKLGVQSRAGAVARAVRDGLVDGE